MKNVSKISPDAIIQNDLTCTIKHAGPSMCFTGTVSQIKVMLKS